MSLTKPPWQLLAATIFTLIGSGGARAESVVVVAASVDVDEGRLEVVANAVAQQGHDPVRFEWGKAAVAAIDRRVGAAAAEVDSAIAAARADYMALDLEPAIARLEKLEADRMTDLLASERGRAALVDLNLWLGNLHIAARQNGEAAARFGLALALDPDLVIDRATFPPAVTSAFEEVKKPSGKTGSLTISTQPAGAAVVLDGGATDHHTPVTVTAPAGWHYVELTLPGFRPWAERLEVTAGDIKSIPLALSPGSPERQSADVARLMSSQLASRPEQTIATVARIARTDRVLVVADRELTLYDANGKTISTVRGDDARAAADQLFTSAVVPGARRSRPLYKNWWFWTAAGVAVLSSAVLIYAVTDDDVLRGYFGPVE